MFSSKRRISLVISCTFAIQILTSTLFDLYKVEAAYSDGGYKTSQTVEESKESTRIDDVDGNGAVSSIDFARTRIVLLGIAAAFLVSNVTKASDVSGDGILNSIDFAYTRQYMLGIINKSPAENSATPTLSNSTAPTPSISVTPMPSNSIPPTPTYVGLSKPTGLEYSLISGTSALISWEPSTDGVKNYAVFKNDNYVGLINEEEYTFTNLIPGETYEFKVCAIDEEYEQSEFSDICVVKTNVSTMDEMKIALINNLENKGTNYTLTYKGELAEYKTKICQAISEAVNESNKPFMLLNWSWSAEGSVGDLKITFEFVYDENNYYAVARSNEVFKFVLLSELHNRTENIGIIYKGTITQSDVSLICEEVLNRDTYLKACIESYASTIRTNKSFEISALTLNFNYKTTKEQEDYVDKTVEFIVSKLTNTDMSDDEKEKLIHDYIITYVDYSEEEKYDNAHSALCYGKAKCDGFAMLTYKMLKAAGIDNIIVTNEDHTWNIVKINENWYHLDTTWDDAKKKDYGFYKYYNLTDDKILETRNYDNVYGKECVVNYIANLTELNYNSDGKYGEILKEIEQVDDYCYVNSFKRTAILTLQYNEVVLKEGESISLVDAKIPIELYEESYQWSTSDEDVATVANGVITAKKAGTILISAQPMYDMLFRSSLFCRVRVIPFD